MPTVAINASIIGRLQPGAGNQSAIPSNEVSSTSTTGHKPKPWSATAPASATANWPWPWPCAVAVLTTGAIQLPGPQQRCRAHPALSAATQPWCATPRREWPGPGPNPVARPRPAQGGRRAAAKRMSLRLTIHDAWLSVDGTRRVVVGLEPRAFDFSHIAKLAKGQPRRLLI
jgi:hypothetical protein